MELSMRCDVVARALSLALEQRVAIPFRRPLLEHEIIPWPINGQRGSGRSFDHHGKMRVDAPVAQLDRVLVSEAKSHRFDSCRARQSLATLTSHRRIRFAFQRCAWSGCHSKHSESTDCPLAPRWCRG